MVSLKKNWVIAISPAAPAQKYAYTLGEAKPVTSGQKLTFSGTVTYGGVADQFHANTGTYTLSIDVTTLLDPEGDRNGLHDHLFDNLRPGHPDQILEPALRLGGGGRRSRASASL